MKIVKIIEHVHYKELDFDVELEYYYDEEFQAECVDIDLYYKNLQKIEDKYNELKKEL